MVGEEQKRRYHQSNVDGEVYFRHDTTVFYTHAPLGWFWIYDSGFSFQLDFGIMDVAATKARLVSSGSAGTGDLAVRDQRVRQIEDGQGSFRISPFGIFGYSF